MTENIEIALKAYEEKDFKEAFKYFKLEKNNEKSHDFDKKYSFKFIKTIYDSIIKEMKEINNENKEYIIYIMTHLKNSDVFYKITVFKVVEILFKKQNPEYDKIIKWLEKLEVELLSDEQQKYESNGKKIVRSSEKEKYYMQLSKAYEKLRNYEKAKEISMEALEKLKEFSNDSDIWLRRRVAEYDVDNKDYDKALSIYKDIQKKKNDWFILREIGIIYLKKCEFTKGKNYLLDAACAFGEVNKKLNLFLDLYIYLKEYDKKLAIMSLKIYFKIRLEENWKITSKDKEMAELENIELSKEELIKISIKRFLENCKELRWKDEVFYKGKVDSIKDKFFFIKREGGERYYCKTKEYPSKKVPVIGTPLKFNLIETFDNKKNKYGFSAINLKLESSKEAL